MPGCLIAMARFNRPSLIVYGGTIKPGNSCQNKPLDIVSAFQSYGEFLAGRISEEERADIVRNACPGAGACGGMYTANSSKCKSCSLKINHSLFSGQCYRGHGYVSTLQLFDSR